MLSVSASPVALPVMGGITPYWVPRGDNGRPAVMVRDHVGGRFWMAGAVQPDVAAFNVASSRTFTRSTVKNTLGPSGALPLMQSTINAEALEWSRAGVPRGLSLEGARSNFLVNSATLVTQNLAVNAQAYTLSFYGTGTVALSGTSTAGPLVGTGANDRVSLTFTPSAGTLTITPSGSVSNAQLEAGTFASSYIATAGTSLTRGADFDAHNDASNSRPFTGFVQGKGAVIWEGDSKLITSGIVAIGDGTLNNRIELARNGNAYTAYGALGGVVQASINSVNIAEDTLARALMVWEANRFEFWLNGVQQGVTDTSFTAPNATTVLVGRNGGGGSPMFGHLGTLAYFDDPPWSRAAILSTIGGV